MKFLKLSFSALLFFSLFSCKKLLEIKETDNIGGDIALATVGNNESAIIGAYLNMNYEMAILLNAVLSDELKVGEFYNSATVHEWQFGADDVSIRDSYNAMVPLYRVVDRANRVLIAMPNAIALKSSDEFIRSRVLGEAYFLRAYAHFELVRYYSGNYDPNGLAMTYMEKPSLLQQTREAMGPYFQKILADIERSKPLLPNNLNDKNRASRLAAVGLQARVATFMREWASANTVSTEFINALPLASTTVFPLIWRDQSTAEVAFQLIRNQNGPRIGSLFRGTSGGASAIGTITWLPSDKILNSYDQTNDVRFNAYFKNEALLTAVNRPSRIITKYAGGAYGDNSSENVANAKIFRTGEMVLIRAEAKAETGDLAGAAADINLLRANRITGYTPRAPYATRDQAIGDIVTERFKELAYEGHRFWNLKRKNLPVDRLAIDAPSTIAQLLPAGNFRFVMPIPRTELNAAPEYQQNPGY